MLSKKICRQCWESRNACWDMFWDDNLSKMRKFHLGEVWDKYRKCRCYKAKKIGCGHWLFVGQDEPPEFCPYRLEHIMESQENVK